MTALAKTAARGYGNRHKTLRAWWKPSVDALKVACWRCGRLIVPDPNLYANGWELGHDDHDRTITRGPEHFHCNRAAGGRKGKQRSMLARRSRFQRSRRW